MFKTITLLTSIVLLSACAGMQQASQDAQRTFVYDYQVEAVDKDELWVRARDYFAEAYGDSRSVLRVQDKDTHRLIGKGAATWALMSNNCASEYNLKFQSKDGKARLQLDLLEGAPSFSACSGWLWPTESGYQSIVADFASLSNGLERALNEKSTFSDF